MKKAHKILLLFLVFLLPAASWQSMNTPNSAPQERKRVAFDETHSEILRLSDGYVAFRLFLQSSGFDVDAFVEGPLTLAKLRAYSAMVLSLPTNLFSSDEVESLIRFVEGGGGLLLMSDCGSDLLWGSNINNISQRFSITFNQDAVKASEGPVVIGHFGTHPITAEVKQFFYHSGVSLEIKGNAIGLASADDNAWADRYAGKVGVLEAEETRGRNVTVIAASYYGLGRVVCLGSSTLFLDGNLVPEHKKLGYNILKWLSSAEPVRAAIQNDLIKLKFLDDNLHSSYQIDIWDSLTRNWTTAYHDVRFYTASADGFNVTWNMGNTSVKTESLGEYQVLVVRYPEVKEYGYESVVIDVGSSGDEEYIFGGGWTRAFEFDNRTVRRVIPGREDFHLLIDYPNHPWLQYTLSFTYADLGKGRVDINALTPNGWTTMKSFYTRNSGSWRDFALALNLSSLHMDPRMNKLRFGIHVEGEPLIIDKILLNTTAASGSIEVTAVINHDSPLVYFFIRKLSGLQLSGVGVIGELATKSALGRRFAFSRRLWDAYLEKGHKVVPSQGVSRSDLNLGTGKDWLHAPPSDRALYIYGQGWSEGFTTRDGTRAREVIAGKTNTFVVTPMPLSLDVLYDVGISYLDAGLAPVDINIFNGSKWVTIGRVIRENTGIWRNFTISIPASELYLEPVAGGIKLGLFAYENNFAVSRITVEEHILGEEKIAVSFSGKKDDIVNFIVVPEAKDRVIQHEVDGSLGVVKTLDIFTHQVPSEDKGVLPVAAVGSVIMDTSCLLSEAEDVVAEGWRPRPFEVSPPMVSGNLAVAKINGSSLSLTVSALTAGQYRVFIRYYDPPEKSSEKELAVYVNGYETGRIKHEGGGFYRLWLGDVELVSGINTIALMPLSRVPTSEIASVDYVLVAPKFWEERAAYELTHGIRDLLGDSDGSDF